MIRSPGDWLARSWPLPALLAWALGQSVWAAARGRGSGELASAALAAAAVAAVAIVVRGAWRRVIVLAGLPLLALAGAVTAPAWAWLAAAMALLAVYPLRAWRDAPFFPTPAGAWRELSTAVPLADGARVLDAGCGLGHGLRMLHRAWPSAQVEGVEWSAALAWLCRRRCRFARVRRADLWSSSWREFALVYLFQRPESMARAWDKACAEMAPGCWLASLEFAVPGVTPARRLDGGDGRPLWLYRVPGRTEPGPVSRRRRVGRGTQPGGRAADKKPNPQPAA